MPRLKVSLVLSWPGLPTALARTLTCAVGCVAGRQEVYGLVLLLDMDSPGLLGSCGAPGTVTPLDWETVTVEQGRSCLSVLHCYNTAGFLDSWGLLTVLSSSEFPAHHGSQTSLFQVQPSASGDEAGLFTPSCFFTSFS